jgi:hypothetical protein
MSWADDNEFQSANNPVVLAIGSRGLGLTNGLLRITVGSRGHIGGFYLQQQAQ